MTDPIILSSNGSDEPEVPFDPADLWAIRTPDGDLTFPGPRELVEAELGRIRESVANDDDDDTDPEGYQAVSLPDGLAG